VFLHCVGRVLHGHGLELGLALTWVHEWMGNWGIPEQGWRWNSGGDASLGRLARWLYFSRWLQSHWFANLLILVYGMVLHLGW